MHVIHQCLVLSLIIFICESYESNYLEFSADKDSPSESFDTWMSQFNSQLRIINKFTATFAWNISIQTNNKQLLDKYAEFNKIKEKWIHQKCIQIDKFMQMPSSFQNNTYQRIFTILCDGPKLTQFQSMQLQNLLYRMQDIFTGSQICIPKNFDICRNFDHIWNFTYVRNSNGNMEKLDMNYVSTITKTQLIPYSKNIENDYSDEWTVKFNPFLCFDGEQDLEKIMKGNFESLGRPDCTLPFNEVLRWTWESWRLVTGSKIKPIYPNIIRLMNIGARNAGYHDIGSIWRKELEIPKLRLVCTRLMDTIRPFYKLLHGVLRYFLHERIKNFEPFNNTKTMPAHMLGSMFGQNWEIYHQLILPFTELNLEENLKNTNWTNMNMVKHADDYYSSMGLQPMTRKFWENSYFGKNDTIKKCHGTAANLYDNEDYRMIICAETNLEDLYVIIHEMGHIHYYMSYDDKQPTIFQDANSALQESIGDAIFLGFMTPQHLNRLQLLPDKYLSIDTNNLPEWHHLKMIRNKSDLSILLKMALAKIPQIPFEYILDIFRWDLFANKIPFKLSNTYFWKLIIEHQGLHPPDWENRYNNFDAAAKFHVADNTPFIRYFLASFLQAQIFRGLCEVTVFGEVKPKQKLPMPLHRCDIYGSKRAGHLLRKALQLGSSVHWSEILFILTGNREISADALLQYYAPLIDWLQAMSIKYKIPIGW